MKINKAGIDLIKRFEGCRLHAYGDPATGKEPYTIGWGHTGENITKDTVWTQTEADDQLSRDITKVTGAIDRVVPRTLTVNQFSAVCALVFNIGIGNFVGHDLLKFLHAGDMKAAADEFPKWNKANGKVMPGLVARRAAEKALFES